MKLSLPFIGFLQALGVAVYCSLVSLFFLQADAFFSVPNYWAPLVFLLLFVFSALLCALLVLGYPIILFWERKETNAALRLVAYSALWLLLFLFLLFSSFLFA